MNLRSGIRLSAARDAGGRLIVAMAVIAAFWSSKEHAPIQPAIRTASPGLAAVNAVGVPFTVPFTVEFYFQAHQDDWQLFLGDRPAKAVNTASKVVFVYTTAGGGASFPAYWQAREQAANASVDTITAAGPWACGNAKVNAHVIYRCTKANTVSYYLRLPNMGDASQLGMSGLRDRAISTLATVDGTATYTSWGDLVSTVQNIISTEAGTEPDANVATHAPETDREANDGDHSDHIATGDLTRTASGKHHYNHFWYIGYPNQYRPENLTPDQRAAKWATVYAYDKVMKKLMGETIIGTSNAEVWVPRTVYRSEPSKGRPAARQRSTSGAPARSSSRRLTTPVVRSTTRLGPHSVTGGSRS